jgi:adenine-specific DNA-methyltransferase
MAEYRHQDETPARPDVGTQPQFRKKAPPKTWRYDSSLAPALDWDSQNAAREQGEALIRQIIEAKSLDDAKAAAAKLKALSKPFLNWAGKAERLSFDVPTLPLFIHERLSTRAILETLKGHRADKQLGLFDLFADPQRPIHEQVLRAYEYQDQWVNRMILGDSLVVMNSLLHYESLGGQVQMIYMDPPYGVKFGSNFQPFVRKRDVSHGDDDDMTREPEMVQAYRDTWELGLHSYLTYLRDRLLLSRELLTPSGSIFVQISDENLHHVREVMEEVFGVEQFVAVIPFRKKTMPLGAKHLESVTDYLIWFAKDIQRVKFRSLFEQMSVEGDSHWNYVELQNGTRRKMTRDEINNHKLLPAGSVPYQLVSLYPAGVNQTGLFTFSFRGKAYKPPGGNSWFTNEAGMKRLSEANRLEPYEDGETLRYVLKLSDSPITTLTNLWADTSAASDKLYVVQTSTKVVQRCMMMTTDPGDLVVDPTCGGGTTGFVAEQWGRRWIMIDTSRVPLALARQRILTARFPWYALKDELRGPSGGFSYKREQNSRGEEVGGVVPYISKGSVASNEPPQEEVLVDRPEEVRGVTRVSGPFAFEATIPNVMDMEAGTDAAGSDTPPCSFPEGEGCLDRMLEVLRRSPVLRLDGKRTVTLKNVRRPAKTLSLSAEAVVSGGDGKPFPRDDGDKPVAILFGPESGAIVERLVYEAAREATAKNYAHLYVIGFAIQPTARQLIESCEAAIGIPATYVQATPDLMMGDLLKNMRSSQIFSVCGLPELALRKVKMPEHAATSPAAKSAKGTWYEVELLGLDLFDPGTMKVDHKRGDDVPAWFLDTDYNGLSFHVSQAFFPRTAAWDNLKRALKGEYEDAVWQHLAGAVSVPFEAGEHAQIAVKVIDDRGNELMVVRGLKEAK